MEENKRIDKKWSFNLQKSVINKFIREKDKKTRKDS